MRYSFTTALTFIKRNMMMTAISIVSISLALVIPAIFMTQYFTARNNFNQYARLVDLQNTYIVNVSSANYQELDVILVDELMNTTNVAKNVHFYSRMHANFIIHNYHFITGIDLTEVTPSIHELYNDDALYQGRWLSNQNEGMVGRRVANLFEVKEGDALNIGNDEFIVTGIFDIPTKNNSIWIHYEENTERTRWNMWYYVQILEVSEQHNESDLTLFFRERGFDADVLHPIHYIQRLESHLASGWLISLLLSVIAILYCMLNIGAVQSLYTNEHQKNSAIMRALGASHSFILAQEFIRTLIISFLTSSLSFLILFLIDDYNLLKIIEMEVGHQTFFFIWLISLLILNIFVIFSHIKTSKCSISSILK